MGRDDDGHKRRVDHHKVLPSGGLCQKAMHDLVAGAVHRRRLWLEPPVVAARAQGIQSGSQVPVRLLTMGDHDNQHVIANLVDYPIIAHADSSQLHRPSQLLGIRWMRVIAKFDQPRNHSFLD